MRPVHPAPPVPAAGVSETPTSPGFARTPEEVTLSGHILSVSATLVGVCLTVIGLVRVVEHFRELQTAQDTLLAFDAIVFLAAAGLAYGALRSATAAAYRRLERAADACFLLGLIFMAVICFVIAYEIV